MVIHIYTVSDATGTTAERVVRAALVQFDTQDIDLIRISGIRSKNDIQRIVTEAAAQNGLIVHTFVLEELRHAILTEGRAMNVTTIDLMGPLLARLTEVLAVEPKRKPGGFQYLFDIGYMQRIDAIDFTVRHDDGKNVHDLERAEIVLVGVSRTSKTPLSIYLAYRGWRVANIPIVLGIDPPKELFSLPKRRIVGLIIRPERLVELRKVRIERMGLYPKGYADLEHIRKELTYALTLFDKHREWPIVDVTTKPIEETAAEVVSLIGMQDQNHKITAENDL